MCLPTATSTLATQHRVNGAGIQIVLQRKPFDRLATALKSFTCRDAGLLSDGAVRHSAIPCIFMWYGMQNDARMCICKAIG